MKQSPWEINNPSSEQKKYVFICNMCQKDQVWTLYDLNVSTYKGQRNSRKNVMFQ
jgi:hypothetical protein